MSTIQEILEKDIQERHNIYSVDTPNKDIDRVEIAPIENPSDKIILRGSSAYSFFWEKTYVKSPERAMDGSMSNLNGTSNFITGHLKINFALMSIDDYRSFMRLIYKSNEFVVSCYDVVYNKRIPEINMYFATQEMPKLWTIVSKKQGGSEQFDDYVDLVGVEGCTVELIGTNTDNVRFVNYFK